MQKQKIQKNVKYLGWASLFTDVSSEMILPILPIFLSTVLKANMAAIGLIEGFAEGMASITKIISGIWSDRIKKRKIFVFIGYLLAAVTRPFFVLATMWQHVFAIRLIDRIGKGIREAPRDALIAEYSHENHRGLSFGFHRMMDTIGAIIGTLLAIFFLKILANPYKTIFLFSFIPALASVLIVAFLAQESTLVNEKPRPLKLRLNAFNKNYKRFVFVSIIFSLANLSYAFFLLKAKDMGISVALIPLLYLLYNIVFAFFSMPLGRMADKIGKRRMLILGYTIFAITCIGFAFVAKIYMLWLLFALYGIYQAIVYSVSRAYVSDLVPAERRGTALGIYHTLTGVVLLPAGFIAGFLWDSYGSSMAFIYATILTIISALLLAFVIKER